MRGKNRGAFLEFLGRTVDRAVPFRVEHQVLALLESQSARAHGVHQVGIWVYRHQPERSSEEVEQALAENLAGSHIKHVFEQSPWNLAGDHRAIEKTLVVWGKNEGT